MVMALGQSGTIEAIPLLEILAHEKFLEGPWCSLQLAMLSCDLVAPPTQMRIQC